MNKDLFIVYPWLKVITEATDTRPPRILMVADGDIDFGHQEFGLSELLKALGRVGDTQPDDMQITTAHRCRKTEGRVADHYEFCFQPDSLEKYDQVWLFGKLRRGAKETLSDKELEVLSEFMNRGGGVFATGDHEDLGYALCGQVPRVRLMRKWCARAEDCSHLPEACRPTAPPVGTERRLDTLREGGDPGFQLDDEGDNTTQTIFPKMTQSDEVCPFLPHPLLRHGKSVIRVMPDHMHEGECIEPAESCLNEKLKFADGPEFEEFPPQWQRGPFLIATTFSVGGYARGDCVPSDINPPVGPRSYGAICVYEDKRDTRQRVGQVVVDASFHHFVDINLDGTGTASHRGLHDADGKPTKDYEAIKQYFRNIVAWLMPGPQKLIRSFNILLSARYMYPLSEEIPPGDRLTTDHIPAVGELTRRAIASRFSPGEARECAAALLEVSGASDELMDFIDPWRRPSAPAGGFKKLINAGASTDLILGAWMTGVAKLLPQDSFAAAEEIRRLGLKEDNFKSAASLRESAVGALASAWVSPTVHALEQILKESRETMRNLLTPTGAAGEQNPE